MQTPLPALDWIVIGVYLAALILFALWLSRSQFDREDYYVGGRGMGAWPIALSIMATQCSTNSILGAPAFVAFAAGGGLVWLQYELAVPLAMIVLILVIMPVFSRARLVSVYTWLEQRYDRRTRLTLAGLFLFVRAFATAVTVYSIAIVIDLITGIGFLGSVLLLGAFTVVYDVIGGIKGVVYSDVIQLAILATVLLILLWVLMGEAGGFSAMLDSLDPERRRTIDFRHHGLGDGETFAFWPMLFGGLFLYVSYYGCDQSQAQRALCAPDLAHTNKALMINGLLRFPLVGLYCLVGVGIAVYAADNPGFLDALAGDSSAPNYNLAVPHFILTSLPAGVVGLAMVALFAAAMSSLDSVLNSLSATTMEDFVRPVVHGEWLAKHELWVARLITVGWGVLTLAMAFWVDDIAPTVLEAINKVGSLANGPILAVFMLGMLTRWASAGGVTLGLLVGIAVNAVCWRYAPSISWLWWNVLGFLVTAGVAMCFASVSSKAVQRDAAPLADLPWPPHRDAVRACVLLAIWFTFLLLLLL